MTKVTVVDYDFNTDSFIMSDGTTVRGKYMTNTINSLLLDENVSFEIKPTDIVYTPASDNREKEIKMQKEEFAKQILAWKKAGHPMYATDVLNMLVEANVLSVSEIHEIEEKTKKEPVEAKLPTSYFND